MAPGDSGHAEDKDGRAHLSNLGRVYSHETWDVYERLDRSLQPRGPDWLLERAGELLRSGDIVLDAGCRDAAHLIQLVQANDVNGVGIEPVPIHFERAQEAVASAGLERRIELVQGTIEDCNYPANFFDLIWCRDVLEQVRPLVPALKQMKRVLKTQGHVLVYTNVVTDRLDARDEAMLKQHMGNVQANLIESNLQAAFTSAELKIEERVVVGTEWREYAEEREQPLSLSLLRLARLGRQREAIIAEHGEDIYCHVEANLHWDVFQMLGKLLPLVYILRHP